TRGVPAVQSALRTAQNFNALKIDKIDDSASDAGVDHAINIDADRAVLGHERVRVWQTAHADRDVVRAGGAACCGQVWRQRAQIGDVGDAARLQLRRTKRRDGDWDFLQLFFALLRGHNDIR